MFNMFLRCRLDFEDADKVFFNLFKALWWVLKHRIIIDRRIMDRIVIDVLCTNFNNLDSKFIFSPVHMCQNLVVEEPLEDIGT